MTSQSSSSANRKYRFSSDLLHWTGGDAVAAMLFLLPPGLPAQGKAAAANATVPIVHVLGFEDVKRRFRSGGNRNGVGAHAGKVRRAV